MGTTSAVLLYSLLWRPIKPSASYRPIAPQIAYGTMTPATPIEVYWWSKNGWILTNVR